jgi:hypothetical protein
MSAAAGAGASDADIIIRGKKLQTLLRNSKLFSHILSGLAEEDIKRIIEHGPRNTDEAIISSNTLNAIDDPMRREFVMAYLKDQKLGTLYPNGTILQGFKQSKIPTANAADYWHYLMVNDPVRRSEAMKKMFNIIPAKPKKTRLAPRAPKNSWSNSSSSNNNSSRNSPMPINNIEFAEKFLSANQLKRVQAMKEKHEKTHTRKHKSKSKKRNTRSHSR